MRRIALLLILVASMASAQKSVPARPAPAKSSDAQLETAIKAKLAKSKINSNHFQVHVQGGVATLEGRTDIVQHKGTATRLAKNAGAVAVNNRIQVSDAGRKKAADNLTEGRRRAQIKRGEPRSQPEPPKK